MNGHCRHCHRYCQGSAEEQGMVWVIAAQRHHARLHLAEWDDGHCPACAEAERIAAARSEGYAEGAAAEREGIVEWLLRSADPGVRALADDVARLVP